MSVGLHTCVLREHRASTIATRGRSTRGIVRCKERHFQSVAVHPRQQSTQGPEVQQRQQEKESIRGTTACLSVICPPPHVPSPSASFAGVCIKLGALKRELWAAIVQQPRHQRLGVVLLWISRSRVPTTSVTMKATWWGAIHAAAAHGSSSRLSRTRARLSTPLQYMKLPSAVVCA